jgi:hypothetical protein
LHGLFKLLRERVLDVLAAGLLNRIQSRLALLPAQRFELRYGSFLPEVLPKDSDIDVFGKSRDQPVGFRQRSSTFEAKTRMASGESIKNTSSVQVTQKSFSTFCSGVPSRVVAPRNTLRRSRGAALRNSEKPEFITTAASLSDHPRPSATGIALLVDLEKFLWAVAFDWSAS